MTHLKPNIKYIHVSLVGGPYDGNVATVHRDARQVKFPRHDPKRTIVRQRIKPVNSYWLYVEQGDGRFHFEAEEVGE